MQVCELRLFDHIIPMATISLRTKSKSIILDCKAVHDLVPSCLSDLISYQSPS